MDIKNLISLSIFQNNKLITIILKIIIFKNIRV